MVHEMMEGGPTMVEKMDDVAYDMENMHLKKHYCGCVLLYCYERSSGSSTDGCNFLELKASCPGLLKMEMTSRDNWPLRAALMFSDWKAAANAVVGLWKLRLQCVHYLTPELPKACMNNAAHKRSIDKELKVLFLSHLGALETGENVQKCKSELEALRLMVLGINKQLRMKNSIGNWSQLLAEKRGILMQLQVMAEQLAEYLNGIKSLEIALDLSCVEDEEPKDGFISETLLLKLGKDWTWHQFHCLIERETHRFKERLPLYAKRGDLLRQIHSNQVLVLSGETGSGKSTQIVQYMVDAGFIEDGFTIVCTQPRRVAVMTLAERVAKEVKGCHGQDPVVGHLTSPALQSRKFEKIMYMTDYTLLQLCLLDKNLRQFGCIIVDEAHERSLNTDLLLAMLKKCLPQRPNLKLIIMSATADATLLSSYFGGCIMYQVVGRSFPVQYIYKPDEENEFHSLEAQPVYPARHVQRVVETVASIKDDGDVLAFLTSQAEVEWASSQQFGPSALVLPLHGKLQAEEQRLVFRRTPAGTRKVVFATNVAETSLTIPGIKFVVDCGLAKEISLDPRSGMNVLKVCQIDRSSAMQRAGRAGRTQEGICYRLYSMHDFDSMVPYKKPEIMRVHLGIAVLKLMALGVQEIESFDFVDSPDPASISLAFKNLHQLGAILVKDGKQVMTPLGWQIAKLGGDPQMCFIALKSISQGLGREGVVIASLLSCSGNIFFRAGSEEEKAKSDCLKIRFCHPHGDIFTLLSVYREWESIHEHRRNYWCFANSINAKSMRRCHEIIKEMERSLHNELHIDVPACWTWSVDGPEECSVALRKILLAAMPSHLAVFSGHESIGYDVLSFGKQGLLHPSSSLLVYGHFPTWVVFGELLCTTRQFLTSVTVVEAEWLLEIEPLLPYDLSQVESSRMTEIVVSNLSSCMLNRICGRSNVRLQSLVKAIQSGNNDQRCILEANHDRRELCIHTTVRLRDRAETLVNDIVETEKRWLQREIVEKCLFQSAAGKSSPVMLFGAGAEIKELIMYGEFASVEIMNVDKEVDDQDVLNMMDKCADGVAAFRRDFSSENGWRWGQVTFCSTKGAAEAVSLLDGAKIGRHCIRVKPILMSNSRDRCRPYFPAVRATLSWPRRQMKGYAVVRCAPEDQGSIINMVSGMLIGRSRIKCRQDGMLYDRGIFIKGLEAEISEQELRQALQHATGFNIEDVTIPRYNAGTQPSIDACKESLVQEIRGFVPAGKFDVFITIGGQSGSLFKAFVKFDESVHEGAAQAIEHLQGRSLPVCKPWQRITCERTFSSSVLCPRLVYAVLKDDISDLMLALQHQNEGTELLLKSSEKGGYYVKIYGRSLRAVAGCKSALEKLLEGTVLSEEGIDVSTVRFFFTREGLQMVKVVEMQTRTFILCDKRNRLVRVFGHGERKNRALKKLSRSLLQLKERKKCHEIELRGTGRPHGLMREVVRLYGADFAGLKVLVGGAYLSLDHRHHTLLVRGSKEEALRVENLIEIVAAKLKGFGGSTIPDKTECCGICFCDLEDPYGLVGCGHKFCRACVQEQIMSAVRHREGFPLFCAHEGCSQRLLIADLETLLTAEQQDELHSASLSAFVTLNRVNYQFCSTPDCPGVYRVSDSDALFECGACLRRICTRCHAEFHWGLTCEEYKEFKMDPDLSLKAWRKGKEHVKCCPCCGSTIEKLEGCNHVFCNCKSHLCWICLGCFTSSEDCYAHLQNLHGGFT